MSRPSQGRQFVRNQGLHAGGSSPDDASSEGCQKLPLSSCKLSSGTQRSSPRAPMDADGRGTLLPQRPGRLGAEGELRTKPDQVRHRRLRRPDRQGHVLLLSPALRARNPSHEGQAAEECGNQAAGVMSLFLSTFCWLFLRWYSPPSDDVTIITSRI